MTIFYVCDNCYEHDPEMCGYEDRQELRVAPDGRWLCISCWDEEKSSQDDPPWPDWQDASAPPRYVPEAAS